MIRKALFFDVDGTLLSEHNKQIPKSAIDALKAARKLGHLIFINSGRVYGLLDEIRGLLDMDGYLCGCGTDIRIDDQLLYHFGIPHERGIEVKKDIIKYGFDGVLEGREGVIIRKQPSHIPAVELFRSSLSKHNCLLPFGWEDNSYNFDKFCIVADDQSDQEGLFGTLVKDFEIIDRGNLFYECVPLGHSKATAIDMVLSKFNIPLEQAYVFGDSTNDLSMFAHVPNAILMQEHDRELEAYASFVTKSVEDDGIAYAMKQLGII